MNPDQRVDANIDAFLKSMGADPQRIRILYGEAKVEKMRGLDEKRVFTVDGASASTLFRRAMDKAGIVDLHFHDTRHEAVTRLANGWMCWSWREWLATVTRGR